MLQALFNKERTGTVTVHLQRFLGHGSYCLVFSATAMVHLRHLSAAPAGDDGTHFAYRLRNSNVFQRHVDLGMDTVAVDVVVRCAHMGDTADLRMALLEVMAQTTHGSVFATQLLDVLRVPEANMVAFVMADQGSTLRDCVLVPAANRTLAANGVGGTHRGPPFCQLVPTALAAGHPCTVLSVIAQIMLGLAAVHANCLVMHADVALDNVLVRSVVLAHGADCDVFVEHPHCVLADHSISAPLDRLFFNAPRHGLACKINMRPPERLMDVATSAASVDVWSLGAMLLEMFAGRHVLMATVASTDDLKQLGAVVLLLGTREATPEAFERMVCDVVCPARRETLRRLGAGLAASPPAVGTLDALLERHVPIVPLRQLVRDALRFDPADRPSVADLLQRYMFLLRSGVSETMWVACGFPLARITQTLVANMVWSLGERGHAALAEAPEAADAAAEDMARWTQDVRLIPDSTPVVWLFSKLMKRARQDDPVHGNDGSDDGSDDSHAPKRPATGCRPSAGHFNRMLAAMIILRANNATAPECTRLLDGMQEVFRVSGAVTYLHAACRNMNVATVARMDNFNRHHDRLARAYAAGTKKRQQK
jgi:hypothetical protein